MNYPLAAGPSESFSRRDSGYAALYRLTDRLYRARTAADVYDAALETIVEALECRRASVMLFDEAGVMQFVAWRGLSDGYRHKLAGHSRWKAGEPEPQPILVEDITWREEGGPAVAPPTRRGFGTHLLGRTLAADIEGDVALDFRPEGLVCTIEAPLPGTESAFG